MKKINWKRSSASIEGYVGDVLCFYVVKSNDRFELVSSLPETTPGDVGRHVVQFHDPKRAMAHAGQLLEHWLERFNR